MLDYFSFKINNYNNNLNIICKFPEEKDHVENKNIIIICNINNMIYDNFLLYLEGVSNHLELIL